jgi:hypothetical protein
MYAKKIDGIIRLNFDLRNTLNAYGFLSNILDKIWNQWQFLMNVTLEDNLNRYKCYF